MSIEQRLAALTEQEMGDVRESELYTSPEMLTFLHALSDTLLRDQRAPVENIRVLYDPSSEMTAGTTGEMIVANAATELVTFFATPEKRFESFLGMILHELSHCLYLDFDGQTKAFETIANGRFWGELPDESTLSPDERVAWQNMNSALSDPGYRRVLVAVYRALSNCLADPHDEDRLIADWPGYASGPLAHTRAALFAGCGIMEDHEANSKGDPGKMLTAAFSAILQMARFGRVHCNDENYPQRSSLLQQLSGVESCCAAARGMDDLHQRFGQMHRIVTHLWPYIEQMVSDARQQQQQSQGEPGEGDPQQSQQQGAQPSNGGDGTGQQQNGSDGGEQQQSAENGANQPQGGNQGDQRGQGRGSGNGQNSQGGQSGGQDNQSSEGPQPISDETLKSILDALNNAEANSGSTQAPQGRRSSDKATGQDSQKDGSAEGKSADEKKPDSSEIIKDLMDDIKRQIAKRRAEVKLENELGEERVREMENNTLQIVNAPDAMSPHKGFDLHVSRVTERYATRIYAKKLAPLKVYSTRTAKLLRRELEDVARGETIRHCLYPSNGRTLIRASDAYRPDKRMFEKRKAPKDMPKIAIAVLVDHSKSMEGDRIEAAQDCAMLLYDVCGQLRIPTMVAGHFFGHRDTCVIVYTDFNKVGQRDAERLAHMSEHVTGCNRDGHALIAVAEQLARRQEDVKLLVIISDGQPNATAYGGEKAAEDIRSVVKQYQKRGVEIMAASIGPDTERIRDIYRTTVLDISDLTKLPKSVVSLVKKRILAALA